MLIRRVAVIAFGLLAAFRCALAASGYTDEERFQIARDGLARCALVFVMARTHGQLPPTDLAQLAVRTCKLPDDEMFELAQATVSRWNIDRDAIAARKVREAERYAYDTALRALADVTN